MHLLAPKVCERLYLALNSINIVEIQIKVVHFHLAALAEGVYVREPELSVRSHTCNPAVQGRKQFSDVSCRRSISSYQLKTTLHALYTGLPERIMSFDSVVANIQDECGSQPDSIVLGNGFHSLCPVKPKVAVSAL